MTAIAYNSFVRDLAQGNINVATDTFYALLVGPSYVPSKAHSKRSDITGEVVGAGYVAGGKVTSITVAVDNATNRTNFTLAGASWLNSSVTARWCVYFKRRGGAASADELVACDDFGADFTSANTDFLVNPSIVRVQN